MLLKIATGDHLHSQLVDVKTGMAVFTTMTRSMFTKTPPKSTEAGMRRASVSSQFTHSSTSSSQTLDEKSWGYPLNRFADGSSIPLEEENLKHTWVLDAEEQVIAEIVFVGTFPRAIKLAGEEPILGRFCSTGLFPNADNQSDVFTASTRIDDFQWVSTKNSMALMTSDEEVAIKYYTNARIDGSGRLRSAYLLAGDAFLEIEDNVKYLEKEELAELLVTFCLMELFRRGRFKLTPYVFDASTAFERYRTIIRDQYIGAASWKLQQAFGLKLRQSPS